MDTSNTNQEPRKWYKKKRYLIPSGLLGLFILIGSLNTPDTSNVESYASHSNQIENIAPSAIPSQTNVQEVNLNNPSAKIEAPQESPVIIPDTVIVPATGISPEIEPTKPEPVKEVPLSNNNTYTNSQGNEVHSPAYAPSVPQGASARCGDGTYSFSQSRRGTCSHHGGVAEWL